MVSAYVIKRWSSVAGALVLVAGCAGPAPPAGSDHAQQAAVAACRQRADETYVRQNRGAVYTDTDQRSSPFSGEYNSGITTRGLADRYGRDNMIASCLRNRGGEANHGAATSTEPVAQ